MSIKDNNQNIINDINEQDVIKINTDYFMIWLTKKMSQKFEVNLEGIRERFLSIYILIKQILEKVMVINNIFIEENEDPESSSKLIESKPILDNMILLLTFMSKEFSECLDLDFVEHFFISIEERLNIFFSLYQQLNDFHHDNPKYNSKIKECTKIIEESINQIPSLVRNLQKRAELSVPLLKHIKDAKTMFRIPLKKLREEIEILALDKYEDFENVLEDVKNRSKGSLKFRLDFVNKMLDLIKENSQYQFELNKMLKPYFSMCSLIKSKGKKLLSENLKLNDQAKIFKFVPIILRPDFCTTVLPTLDINELIYIIKLFEQQHTLVSEYKKTLIRGIEEYNQMNSIEFEVIIGKYKQVIEEVNNGFQELTKKNTENFKNCKESFNQLLKDIKKTVEKYKEFQNGVYHYQVILDLFQKIKNLAVKFCFKEFNLKVELICDLKMIQENKNN